MIDGEELLAAMTDCEATFPGCRWSVGRPPVWADGVPVRVRKVKPYEAWITHGDIGKRGFICAVGDGETPTDALNAALTKAIAEAAALKEQAA